MSRVQHVQRGTAEFFRAAARCSIKHAMALYTLDQLGYEPVYINDKGKFVLLGRTLAYRALKEENYQYDPLGQYWYNNDLPF